MSKELYRPYKDWTERALRNGILSLSNGMSISGGYCDIEMLRQELRLRGLDDRGYHNT